VGNGGQQSGATPRIPAAPAGPGAGSNLGGIQPPKPPPANNPAAPPKPPPAPGGDPLHPSRGSGPNGEFTIEDLMHMRDAWQQQQAGGK
jgi:hypothetical protein